MTENKEALTTHIHQDGPSPSSYQMTLTERIMDVATAMPLIIGSAAAIYYPFAAGWAGDIGQYLPKGLDVGYAMALASGIHFRGNENQYRQNASLFTLGTSFFPELPSVINGAFDANTVGAIGLKILAFYAGSGALSGAILGVRYLFRRE